VVPTLPTAPTTNHQLGLNYPTDINDTPYADIFK
jgi:hypothetical protein